MENMQSQVWHQLAKDKVLNHFQSHTETGLSESQVEDYKNIMVPIY
ncbi:cation-transporting P-type ATPase [Piscirickettsia salmonis]|nr:cation-transporting P-type ATPase [Piscirickettsia salmonis]